MPPTFALQKLRELAESNADSAAASLGALNRQLQAHQEKLALLHKYREDYQLRFRQSTDSGVDAAALRNFVDFMSRLEQAIRQQQALVDDVRSRVECSRTDWQFKQRKSKAFGTLEQRHSESLRRHAELIEQKTQDDHASRVRRATDHAHVHPSNLNARNRRQS